MKWSCPTAHVCAFVFFLGGVFAHAGDFDVAENARVAKWAKEIKGVAIQRWFATTGDEKIVGLKGTYVADFKRANASWQIRRYARPQYGDYLDLSKVDSQGDERRLERVLCPKTGIREADVRKLLSKLP